MIASVYNVFFFVVVEKYYFIPLKQNVIALTIPLSYEKYQCINRYILLMQNICENILIIVNKIHPKYYQAGKIFGLRLLQCVPSFSFIFR